MLKGGGKSDRPGLLPRDRYRVVSASPGTIVRVCRLPSSEGRVVLGEFGCCGTVDVSQQDQVAVVGLMAVVNNDEGTAKTAPSGCEIEAWGQDNAG